MATISVTILTPPTLANGSGFSGATSQPAAVGSGPFSTRNAICRWNVVPFQEVTSTLRIGVVAFHPNGINYVEFIANGGATSTVRSTSHNPDSGTVEYAAKFDASLFADALIEIRAIVYPVAGQPIVLGGTVTQASNGRHSLYLLANHGGTATGSTLYCATTGSDSTGDGSQGNPYRTPQKCAVNVSSASNSTVYCAAGEYTVAGTSNVGGTPAGYVTIQPAPGVTRAEVIIRQAEGAAIGNGIQVLKLRWKNLTIHPNGTDQWAFFDSGAGSNYIWIDSCICRGLGAETGYQFWATKRQAGLYITDSEFSECVDGVWTSDLIRNSRIHDILSDVFRSFGIAVNCHCDFPHSAFYGTGLKVDASNNKLVQPDKYTPIAANVTGGNYTFTITTNTGGWTAGEYTIDSISSGKWLLHTSPAAAGTTGGAWTLLTGAHSDYNQWLGDGAENSIMLDCTGDYGSASGISAGSQDISDPITDTALVNVQLDGDAAGTGFYNGTVCTNFYVKDCDFGDGFSYWYNPGLLNGFEAHDVVLENSTFGSGDMAETGVTIR